MVARTWKPGTLVAICGSSKTGKDEAAAPLLARGFGFGSFGLHVFALMRDVNFPVRLSTGNYVGIADLYEHEYGGDFEAVKALPEVRLAMQEVGSHVKDRDPTFWVDVVLNAADPAEPLVVVGPRSPDEVRALEAAGALTLRLLRPGTGAMNDHRNDTDLDRCRFTHVITNDGTVADLHDTVLSVVTGDESLRRLDVLTAAGRPAR